MQTLNFLNETPLITWFDFACFDLKKLWAHLSSPLADPSSSQLLTQLCDQAFLEERDAARPGTSLEDNSMSLRKAKALRILALKILAYRDWDLRILSRQVSVLNQKSLIDALLLECGIAKFAEFSFGSALPQEVFAVVFCARWVLHAALVESYPKPAQKATVSNPGVQPDPALQSAECNLSILGDVRALCECSVKILCEFETWMKSGKFEILRQDCFVFPSERCEHRWELSERVKNEQILAQIRFDIATHLFARRNLPESKRMFELVLASDSIFSLAPTLRIPLEDLYGYCQALQITQNIDVLRSKIQCKQQKSSSELKDLLSDASDGRRFSLTTISRVRASNPSSKFEAFSYFILRVWLSEIAACRTLIRALRRRACSKDFCALLNRTLPVLSEEDKARLRVFLRCVSKRADFPQSLLEESFGIKSTPKKGSVSKPFTPTRRVSSVLEPLDAQWKLSCSFSLGDIRSALAKTPSGSRVSVYWQPSLKPFQSVLARFGTSPSQELAVILLGKSQQLFELGEMRAYSRCMTSVSEEVATVDRSLADSMLRWEEARASIANWHAQLHLQSDVAATGQHTATVEKLAKNVLSEAQRQPNMPLPPEELLLQCAAFFLNTCDWAYLLGECTKNGIKSRFFDFAILVAALCYDITTYRGENVRTVAKRFYEVTVLTATDSAQTKRGGGEQVVLREMDATKVLLMRAQLRAVLRLVKEPLALSLLQSFFANLHNRALAVAALPVFSEHRELWPPSGGEQLLNALFVDEMLEMCLHASTTVNPINAFWLRSRGDFECGRERWAEAMRFYSQSTLACSESLTQRLPENVVDQEMLRSMIRCLSRMQCEMQTAVMVQFLDSPDYALALKALESSTCSSLDGSDAFYALIWDVTLLEELVFALKRRNLRGLLEIALRALSSSELNASNTPEVLAVAAGKRRMRFLMALCLQFA